ncbi:MAG: amidohydrolase family protein [Tissierellia bacterium]|nr:amidohydrolase family protein [Tissierellia bacterium]
MKKTLIRNGYLIDPGSRLEGFYDLLIENNKIERIEKDIKYSKNVNIIDGKNKYIVPGFIDLQVNPGNSIEYISDILPFCGITTPLVMPCNVLGKPFLTYYEGLENMLKSCEGLRVNIANAISIEPPDTGGHETYMQLAVDMDSIEERVLELIQLGVTAVGEVVLPLGGLAHISSDMSREFLDRLLDVTEKYDMPILLHTGAGINGIKEAVEVSKGRRLHICHIGSTCSQDNIHEAITLISRNENITSDTHLSEVAGSNSKESKLVIDYYNKGEVVNIDKDTLKITTVRNLETANPPYYYNKVNLFENNITCALSERINAIESDDLGDGIRARILLKNFFRLVNSTEMEHIKVKFIKKLVKKLTYNPAQILNIDRGILKEGSYADIVLLDLENEKVDTVLVNGEIVLDNGKLTDNKPGKRIEFKSK